MSQTATHSAAVADFAARSASGRGDPAIRLCHFTTAHTRIEEPLVPSRMPAARRRPGFGVRYVAPMSPSRCRASGDGLTSLPTPRTRAGSAARSHFPRYFANFCARTRSLYHFQDPELLPLAFVLKLIFRKRVIYDAYEDFPSMARKQAGRFRAHSHAARRKSSRLRRNLIAARCLDGVMTADPFTLRRFARTGKSRKLVFYNFPNLDFFPRSAAQGKAIRCCLSRRAFGTRGNLRSARRPAIARGPSAQRALLLIGYFDSAAAEDQNPRTNSRLGPRIERRNSRPDRPRRNGRRLEPGPHRRVSAATVPKFC